MNKEEQDLKASEWITSHTKELNGKPYIDAVNCLIELYARVMAVQENIKRINESIGDICLWADPIEKRVNTLEGSKNITVVSESEAKTILKI